MFTREERHFYELDRKVGVWRAHGHPASRSPARFDGDKLRWLNQQYIKEADNARLAELAEPFLKRDGCDIARGAPLANVVALLKDRVSTIEELADAAVYFYRELEPSAELKAQHFTVDIKPAMAALHDKLSRVEWNRANISGAVKAVVAEHKRKMPQIAMPLRVMVTGETQTPSVDATLELIGKDAVLARMAKQLQAFPA